MPVAEYPMQDFLIVVAVVPKMVPKDTDSIPDSLSCRIQRLPAAAEMKCQQPLDLDRRHYHLLNLHDLSPGNRNPRHLTSACVIAARAARAACRSC